MTESDKVISSQNTRNHRVWIGGSVVLLLMIGIGAFARNGWLPDTDAMTGRKTGWFGKELPKNAGSSWNPLAAALPTATPQLSKEYIYAGSRMLAAVDAGANAAPPADLAVWRPSSGTWYVLGGTGSAQTEYQWGASGDEPVPGDFDGDGKTDFSVFRPSSGEWYVLQSSNNAWMGVLAWGQSTDKRVAADFDGDGKTDRAVWRPGDGTWYIFQSSTQSAVYRTFGSNGDIPAPADYDGDGKADLAVWRDNNRTFYSINSGNSQSTSSNFATSITSGTAATPVSSDYDGDGKADYAVRSGANWIIVSSATSATSLTS